MRNPWRWLAAICFVTGSLYLMASGGIQSAYRTVENAGTPLTERQILNFTGAGVSCSDSSPTTVCSIPGGSSVTSAAPYIQVGGTSYIPADNMYQATLPSFTGFSYLGSPTFTETAGANGNYLLDPGGNSVWYAQTSSVVSIEAVFTEWNIASSNEIGIFMCDGTNHVIWALALINPTIEIFKFTYTGSGCGTATPSAEAGGGSDGSLQGNVMHLKLAVSGTTLTGSISLDGGATYKAFSPTEIVGTIAGSGIYAQGLPMDLMSLALR